MKRMNYLAMATIAILIFSCSDKKEFVTTFRGNIEGGDWINCPTIGYYGGKTGDCCSKVDATHEYSYGFSKLVSEISLNPIKKVKLSVWVKLENKDIKTVLVVAIGSPKNKNIYWEGRDLNPVVKEANKWYKFEVEEILPAFDAEGAHLETYVWNPNKNTAYVDDFEICFLGE